MEGLTMSVLTDDERKLFEKKYYENNPPRATVLVCGWTGAGKSSLIKTMLDVDAPISDGTPCTQQFDVYENKKVRVYDSKGMEKGELVRDFVQKLDGFIKGRRTTSSIERNIHIIWYVIDAVACRFDDGDTAIVNELNNLVGEHNLLFILTKCDSARQNQINGLIQKITASCGVTERDIIPVCDEKGRQDPEIKPAIRNGVLYLLERTLSILPEALHASMEMAQKADLEMKNQIIEQIIESIKNKKSNSLIIVTKSKIEKDTGQILKDLISESGKYEAALWDVKDFEENESEVLSTQKVIFIGANEFSLRSFNSVKWKYKELNMQYGWIGSVAVIMVGNDNLSKDDLEKFKSMCVNQENEVKKSSKLKVAGNIAAAAVLAVAGGLIGIGIFGIVKLVSGKMEAKNELIKKEYGFLIVNFFINHLESFMEI